MAQTDKLAYFLEADQLAGVFAEWPSDMNVVLCLDEAGSCEILVYHEGEGRSVLRKVAAIMGRSLGEFLVVPEMRGYPTRKVLFSEEQKLLSIVAEAWHLPESAQDYAINYRYAQDQGLNPDTMKPREAAKPKPAPVETAEVITPTFRHRAKPETPPAATSKPLVAKRPQGIRPRLRLTMGGLARAVAPAPEPAPVAEPRFPPGYAPAAELALDDCQMLDGQIFEQDGAIRLVISRLRMSVRTAPVKVDALCFRDDFARFMIPREALSGWTAGEAAVLDLPLDQFPAALVRRFGAARGAEVTVTPKGVFVAPGEVLKDFVPLEGRPKPLLRRVVTPLRAAMLAMVAVGAAAGAILSYMQDGQLGVFDQRAVNTTQPAGPEVTRFIGTPLDLIGSMAREEAQK